MTQEEITRMFENIPADRMQSYLKYMATQEAEHEAVTKGKTDEEIIKIYLDSLAKLDPQLATKYPTNTRGKSIEDCMQYIESLAQKMAKNKRSVAINSFTVFEWTVRYFMDDEIKKFEVVKPAPVVPTKPAKVTLASLQAEKEKWQANIKKQIDDWEVDHNAKIDQWEQEHKQDLFPEENPHVKEQNPFLAAVFPQQAELDRLLAEKNKPAAPEPAADKPAEDPEPETQDQEEDGEIIEEASPEEIGELEY